MRAPGRADRALVRVTSIAALAATLVGARAPAQSISWTGAAQGASGKYIFAERTTTASVSNGLVVVAGPLVFSGSIPVVYQSTPWISQSGAGVIPTGGPQGGETHGSGPGGGGGGRGSGQGPGPIRYALAGGSVVLQDTAQYDQIGIGDPMAFASLRLLGGPGRWPALHVTGAAKAPLASVRSGVGTGQWDFGAGASVTAPFGALVVGVDATRWWLGDMPDLAIDDPITYGATVTHYLAANRYSIFGTFWGASKTFADTEAPRQAGVGACRVYAGVCALGFTVSAGLSSSSPDIAVGMTWQVPLRR